MNKTLLTTGLAFVGGCLICGGIKMLVDNIKKRTEDIYYYKSLDVDNGKDVVDAIISENKLGDFLAAIIDVTVTEPTIMIDRDDCEIGCVRVTFDANYEEHLEILSKAGINYNIDEEE